MSEETLPKLPGWTRRADEFTPTLNLSGTVASSARPDIDTFLDPANGVAYKMIGGAFGVLGAEVLGHFVPRALDSERWGIYVREAGVAWLCSQFMPKVSGDETLVKEGIVRLARGIAAHHYVHCVVEKAISAARGASSYVDTLRVCAPRHPASEEALADTLLSTVVVAELRGPSLGLMRGILDDVMAGSPARTPKPSRANVSELLTDLNSDLNLSITESELAPSVESHTVPEYLVLEPHLPEPTAALVRSSLLP